MLKHFTILVAVALALLASAAPGSAQSAADIQAAITAATGSPPNMTSLDAMLTANAGNPTTLAAITNAVAKTNNANLMAGMMESTGNRSAAVQAAMAASIANPVNGVSAAVVTDIIVQSGQNGGTSVATALGQAMTDAGNTSLVKAVANDLAHVAAREGLTSNAAISAFGTATGNSVGFSSGILFTNNYFQTSFILTLPNPAQVIVTSPN
jgi:hypothetical protein